MSPENVPDKCAQYRAVVDALNARDFDAVTELVAPDLEFRSTLAIEAQVYTGIDGLKRWAADVDATWEDFRVEVVECHDVGAERAVAVNRNTGRARVSGVPLDDVRGVVLTWRNGQAWRNVVYQHPEEAFRAVGLTDGRARSAGPP